ncbi:MAG: LLM class flavin-dependent oxidoreductase [Vicinamibacterales bacterium]
MSSEVRGWFVGSGALLLRCAELYLDRGHVIAGMASSDASVRDWAAARQLPTSAPGPELVHALARSPFEYLFSIGNHAVLPDAVLTAASRLAINFHYGPLPEYAGVHVPVWALLRGERRYGVTWHEMTADVDAGRIAVRASFDLPAGETAADLLARCHEHGLQSFGTLLDQIARDALTLTPQAPASREVFRRHARPDGHAVVDFAAPADEVLRLVRALDFGPLENPFASARLIVPGGAVILAAAEDAGASPAPTPPGTVVSIGDAAVVVATATSRVAIRAVRRLTGEPLSLAAFVEAAGLAPGSVLPTGAAAADPAALEAAVRHESHWVRALASIEPVAVPYLDAGAPGAAPDLDAATPATPDPPHARTTVEVPRDVVDALGGSPDTGATLLALAATYLTRLSGAQAATLALRTPALSRLRSPLLATQVPVRVDLARPWSEVRRTLAARVDETATRGTFFVDACARHPESAALSAFGRWRHHVVLCLADDPSAVDVPAETTLMIVAAPAGTSLTWIASAALPAASIAAMQHQLGTVAAALAADADQPLEDLPLLDADEARTVLHRWNETARPVESRAIHELFEAQADRTPDRVAVVHRDRSLTYRELDERANALAARLTALGVGPEEVVGVFVDRSPDMLVALLGILKAGGAYLPLDPAFPQARLAWMLEATEARAIVTQAALGSALPRHQAQVVFVDAAASESSSRRPSSGVRPEHLAYVIFTSGSTGRPKGVMVEHRQVASFFAGMDEHLGGADGGTWLAVTSISFDISVLELFWTLARGFTVVVQEELRRAAGEAGTGDEAPARRPMDFSLFYFSADATEDRRQPYRLLLEGARYADAHGFRAVWTPERHFHEFGGLYPNPAVTSAAVAAVTSRVRVRAGSVVLPLHNPLRVAEEWAVVDNLSQGRVELSFASGWHANDFALRPENYKDRRDVMARGIETIRTLWRGERVPAVNGHGEPIEVKVFPAPHQPQPPIWIAAAGNIETFRMAGRLGARLLTNLLGQKTDDVATKVAAYREAWREAGHDGDGTVALMLHTFVGPDLDRVRETVRRPLIEYLKTSTELVRQTRWEFPAFATPGGARPVGDVDLSEAELDALMGHAFERYFRTSGLFGTPEMCLERVRELQAIGIDEIACLLDFGVATDTVLAHLPYLNQVRAASAAASASQGDFTIAAQIERHGVTHLQATPSLMRAIVADGHGRAALGRVSTLLVGGEALPPSLAADLLACSAGRVLNMYGPTETTVWSTVAPISDASEVTIGRPIANTRTYVVDRRGLPVPVGVPGELLIGGSGVTRGYWRRPDLTAERFVANTAVRDSGDRLYRTGDVARYRPDGRLECLGRIDHQVKVGGHRIELGEIEATLAAHPEVSQAVAVVRGTKDARDGTDATTPGESGSGAARLIAYVVPARRSPGDTGGVERWQAVWDETHGGLNRNAPAADAAFDTSGWRDSYTGEPTSEADMREWVDRTVARVLALRPRRILEIGCGTGLLLHRLAPACEHYTGVDFSPTAIRRLQSAVDAAELDHVSLRVAAADTIGAQPDLGPVDVVILNSVVQYFPDVDYLVRVIERAAALVSPGGSLFVGDVRSRALLEAFHTSVELAQAPALMAATDLRQRIRDRVAQDPELVIDPAFFEALRAHLPAITGVDVRLKAGRRWNEMTRFRYDVVLRVGGAPSAPAPERHASGQGLSSGDVAALLDAGTSVVLTGILNPRVAADCAAVRMLAAPDGPETVADLRQRLDARPAEGIDPEALADAAPGWTVECRWTSPDAPDRYDAILRAPGAEARRDVAAPAAAAPPRPWREYVHQAEPHQGRLVQTLKAHLRTRLPAYMVPSAIVCLEALPLTPNGKIDRQALPEPDHRRDRRASAYVAPETPYERQIAETWQALLALDRVGVHDNFFDLGANSLLVVQAHAALRDRFDRPLSLVDLFRYPTVSALAGFLKQEHDGASVLAESEARAQARREAMSRRRRPSPSVPAGRAAIPPQES